MEISPSRGIRVKISIKLGFSHDSQSILNKNSEKDLLGTWIRAKTRTFSPKKAQNLQRGYISESGIRRLYFLYALQTLVCPPIIQEVLQGINLDRYHGPIKNSLRAFTRIGDPVRLEDYLLAAEIYRIGRGKGYTIRSSIDCLIAALAIQANVPIWHKDRDFDFIAQFTSLKIFTVS